MMQKSLFCLGFSAWGALGGLKLDEIDATNSFLMLLMARNGLKWPFKNHLRPNKNHKKSQNCEKNGHETDLEMSPRPLGTTVFEEIYIRTMGK